MKNFFNGKKAQLFALEAKDFLKGLIVSVLTVIVTMAADIIKDGNFPTDGDWQLIWKASVSAGLAYIIKNWLTNSKDQFMKKEK